MTAPLEIASPDGPMLSLGDVVRATKLPRSGIYRRMAEHAFPRPVKITSRIVRWRRQDVDAWVVIERQRAALPRKALRRIDRRASGIIKGLTIPERTHEALLLAAETRHRTLEDLLRGLLVAIAEGDLVDAVLNEE